jgi:membrane associated rhomboid family serine protease
MIIIIFGGLLLWTIGEPTYHVGASLLIYGLAAFLFLSGILRKKITVLIVSIAIAIIYGGMVWGLLPQNLHISWIGHICGAVAGLISSIAFRKNKYDENRQT